MNSIRGIHVIVGHDGRKWEVNFDARLRPVMGEAAEVHVIAHSIKDGKVNGAFRRVPFSWALQYLEERQVTAFMAD